MPPRKHPFRQQADYWRARHPALARGSLLLRDYVIHGRDPYWHFHPEIELIGILHGEGAGFVGDAMVRPRPGNLFLLGADLPHSWHNAPRAPSAIGTRVLQFHPGIFGNLIEVNRDLAAIATLLHRARGGMELTGRARRIGLEWLEQAMRLTPGDPRRLTGLLGLLAQLAIETGSSRCSRGLSQAPLPPRDRDPEFEELLARLETHLGEPMTQASVARLVGRKPAAFSRWFRRRTRMTFMRYLSDLRLSRTAQGLLTGDRPIADLATESGFASLTHFYRTFRQRYGETPAAYRRRGDGAPGKDRATISIAPARSARGSMKRK